MWQPAQRETRTSRKPCHFLSRASRRLCSFRVAPVSAAGSLQRGANNQAYRTAIQAEASGVCVNEPAQVPTLSRAPIARGRWLADPARARPAPATLLLGVLGRFIA